MPRPASETRSPGPTIAGRSVARRLAETIPARRLAVAVSGGSDSVALLLLLAEARRWADFEVVVFHVDHAARPDSSADARWVEALAARLGFPCRTRSLPAPGPKELSHLGWEAWARTQRLRQFADLCRETGCEAVATGHTREDQAETVLLRLIRGTSVRGLAGIRPLRTLRCGEGSPKHSPDWVSAGARPGEDSLRLWRPLLDCSRESLRAWLRRRKQDWREDSTNQDPRFLRNRLRRDVLPLLESIRPGIAARLSDLASEAGEIAPRLSSSARSLLRAATPDFLPRDRGLSAAQWRLVLGRWQPQAMPGRPWNGATLKRLLDLIAGPCGRRLPIGERTLVRTAAGLALLPRAEALGPAAFRASDQANLPLEGEREFAGRRFCLTTTPPREAVGCWVDSVRIPANGVTIRFRRPGDRFHRSGAPGARKLGRWLIDWKIPAHQRDQIPVIAVGGEVLWLPDLAWADGLSATPGPDWLFLGVRPKNETPA